MSCSQLDTIPKTSKEKPSTKRKEKPSTKRRVGINIKKSENDDNVVGKLKQVRYSSNPPPLPHGHDGHDHNHNHNHDHCHCHCTDPRQSVSKSSIASHTYVDNSQLCRYDPRCENLECSYTHLSKTLYCEYETRCTYYYCRKQHPYGRIKKCDYNMKCWNYGCKFLHGKGWRPCPLGETCPDSNTTCQKVHPPSQKESKTNENVNADAAVVEGADLNILLIGETGSGKSTFINTVTNLCRGGTVDKPYAAIPTKYVPATEEFDSKELDVHNSSISQTDDCNVYRFSYKRRVFNFIDTPGLGDTRGTEQDDRNIDKILEAGIKLKEITAIMFVLNGTASRLTTNLKNVIARFRGFVPDALLQNTVVLFTHCWEHNRNFDLKSFANELGSQRVFHIDNSAFCNDPNQRTEMSRKRIQNDWFYSMKETENILNFFLRMKSINTNFVSIKKSRDAIKQALHSFQLRIVALQALQLKFDEAEQVLTQCNENKKQFENYIQKKTITKTELVDAEKHSTICSQCNVVCHQDCGLNEIASPGSDEFQNCACMHDGRCGKCKGKCSYKYHYHARKRFETTTKTLEVVLQDIKIKFDVAEKKMKKQAKKFESVQCAKQAIKKAVKIEKKKILRECTQLKKICVHFNLVDEMHEKLIQLKMQARTLQNYTARENANEIITIIQKICDELS